MGRGNFVPRSRSVWEIIERAEDEPSHKEEVGGNGGFLALRFSEKGIKCVIVDHCQGLEQVTSNCNLVPRAFPWERGWSNCRFHTE